MLSLSLADEHPLFETKLEQGEPETMDSWLKRYPSAWVETVGIGLARPPVIVQLTAAALPVRVRQYPMPEEARKGRVPHIHRLLEAGLLRPCRSAWIAPLLPVKKPGSNHYRPVQDLREISERVEDIHPAALNLRLDLATSRLPMCGITTLGLKGTFFSVPLSEASQPLFAVEWPEPGGRKDRTTNLGQVASRI